jgi:3-hydroxyisobutyrate dehydrogenase-like beta-hydroxyacid dehydrogenase
MNDKIGFIGIGEMGLPMAKNLMESGYGVYFFDMNRDAMDELAKFGGTKCSSVGEVGESSEIIFVMVRTTAQAEAIVSGSSGLLDACRPGTCIIISSTIDPASVQKMAAEAENKDIRLLDAPVSGGKQGAEAGTLSIMVGGGKDVGEKFGAILDVIGKNIFYMGHIGMGEAAKLTNNLLLLIHMNAAYEAMDFAEKAGMDMDLLRDLLKVSTGNSWVVENWDMVTSWKKNYMPEGTLDLIYKDFKLASEAAQNLETPLHLGAVASQLGRY